MIISAARSPIAYTPRNVPPRSAARVRPEPRNAAALIEVTPMHAVDGLLERGRVRLDVLRDEGVAQVAALGGVLAPVQGVEHVAADPQRGADEPVRARREPGAERGEADDRARREPGRQRPGVGEAREERRVGGVGAQEFVTEPVDEQQRHRPRPRQREDARRSGRAAERGDGGGQHLGERAAPVLGHDGSVHPRSLPSRAALWDAIADGWAWRLAVSKWRLAVLEMATRRHRKGDSPSRLAAPRPAPTVRGVSAGPDRTAVAQGTTVALERRARILDDGAVLLGGSPPRMLHLSPTAAARLVDGRLTVTDATSAALARRLLDAGIAHPVAEPAAAVPPPSEVTVVIPVKDRTDGLARLLAALEIDVSGVRGGPNPAYVDLGRAGPRGCA